ncbi:MAG TPA: vitamin K epoxide reductase family protein, partial [Candidatus Wunengus sp. YC63]|uniref:vitamin K epoxide reductase family protein n=1 Tax=Candidatus Wunengus sp. YC63 TaxID=3367699 RepID=UPI004026B1F9
MIQLDKFIIHVMQNAPQIMWFLGAGTSRSAGMPSAEDIIWDLKRRYYCLHEGKEVDHYDLNNEAIKHKIQAYLDAQQRFPVLWAKDEYEFYFDKFFQGNLEQQQRYIEEQLAPEKLSLNSGHKILAALLAMGKTKIVFTTNFDAVIEKAYAEINGGMLQTYHLEGSYAALDALNNESYPFYIKLHGDFRYRSIKNLPSQLKSNDEQLRKAFVSACARYGLIVSGYLLLLYTSGAPIPCGLHASCEVVRSSVYASWFGIPTPAFGVIFYLLLAVLAEMGQPNPSARYRWALWITVSIGVG